MHGGRDDVNSFISLARSRCLSPCFIISLSLYLSFSLSLSIVLSLFLSVRLSLSLSLSLSESQLSLMHVRRTCLPSCNSRFFEPRACLRGTPVRVREEHLATDDRALSRRVFMPYRGTSLIRKRTPLAPYSRTMPRAL